MLDPNQGISWIPPEELETWISRLVSSVDDIETSLPQLVNTNPAKSSEKPFVKTHSHKNICQPGRNVMRDKVSTENYIH